MPEPSCADKRPAFFDEEQSGGQSFTTSARVTKGAFGRSGREDVMDSIAAASRQSWYRPRHRPAKDHSLWRRHDPSRGYAGGRLRQAKENRPLGRSGVPTPGEISQAGCFLGFLEGVVDDVDHRARVESDQHLDEGPEGSPLVAVEGIHPVYDVPLLRRQIAPPLTTRRRAAQPLRLISGDAPADPATRRGRMPARLLPPQRDLGRFAAIQACGMPPANPC